MNIKLSTPKPLEECKRLLAAALGRQGGSAGRAIVGQVEDSRFRVCLPVYRGGRVASCLQGQLQLEGDGTSVRARYRSPIWGLAGAAFGLLLVLTILFSLLLTGDLLFDQKPGVTLAILLAGGLIIFYLARGAYNRNRARLIDFVGMNLVPDYQPKASEGSWAIKRVEVGVYIEAPVSRIWAALTDPESFPDWIQSMQRVEMLTPGEYGVGTKYRPIAGTGQRTVDWTVEVIGIEPERLVQFRYSGFVEGTGGWRIEPIEGGFYVTSFDEFESGGGLRDKIINRFVMDSAARAAREESLRQLKELLEEQD